MQMVMCTKANGRMIRLMEKEVTSMQMELLTLESGKTINSTVTEQKHGQMGLSIRDSTPRVKSTGKEL